MNGERSQKQARLRAYCQRPGSAVLFDETAGLFIDVPSGKSLSADAGELEHLEERTNSQTGQPYLALAYGDGRSLALAEMGVAFAPDCRQTGPLPELPAAVCWKDFFGLRDRLKHELYGHPEQAPTRNTVKLVMMCLAVLDGARAAGFEVGKEERELEVHLAELERRGAP
ncbi:MAG: hypothetical protein ACOZIN_22690 [Myxococcota bacterium]